MQAAAKPPDTLPLPPLRAAARGVLAKAAQALEAATAGRAPAAAIHDFRVAMKRWRALLRLLQGVVGDEAVVLRRQAGRLTRPLGVSRDAQAALDALDDLGEPETGAFAPIVAKLNVIRAGSERIALDAATLQRLRAGLSRAAAACAAWPLESVTPSDIADALARSYRRARRRMPADWDTATPTDIHAFRKAVVIFRYQTQIAAPLWPEPMRAHAGEAQKLRTRLGRSNDLLVLADFLRPRRPLTAWRKPLTDPLQAKRRRHLAKAAELARHLFADKPRQFRHRLAAG